MQPFHGIRRSYSLRMDATCGLQHGSQCIFYARHVQDGSSRMNPVDYACCYRTQADHIPLYDMRRS